MPLNDRQEKFVQEYLKDLNATQAAIRAGYSESTARSIGSENLTKPDIQAEIAKAKAKRSKRVEISQDRVVQEMAKLALADTRTLLDADGNVKNPHEWDDAAAACVSAIEATTDKDGNTTYEIKTWDKNTALTNLGKHLGTFVEKHEITGRDGGPIEVQTESKEGRDLAREILFAIRKGMDVNGSSAE